MLSLSSERISFAGEGQDDHDLLLASGKLEQ